MYPNYTRRQGSHEKILVTGACGFIGHHFVEHLLKNTDWDIVVLDRLNYAGTLDRLRDIKAFDENRVQLFVADFTLPVTENLAKEIGGVDYIVHMGAETHVDNSIEDPWPFINSNVIGTYRMLEFAKSQPLLKKFLYFSTDEVFGPAPSGVWYKEGDRHNPSNPYSAAKSGGEQLCIAYANTYKIPILITNTMNVFGERQHPEKFIPLSVKKVLSGEEVIIHSNKEKTKAGSRFYIHARNVSDAVLFLLLKSSETLDIHDPGKGKYNIVGEKEIDNLSLAKLIAKILDKPLRYQMIDFHSSRPGHDLRYALDDRKMRSFGWSPPVGVEKSLEKTIQWMLLPENKRWLDE